MRRATIISTLVMTTIVLSCITILYLEQQHDIDVLSYLSVFSIERQLFGEQISKEILENEQKKELISDGVQRPHYIIKAQLNEQKAIIDGNMTVKTIVPANDTLVFNSYPTYVANNMVIHDVFLNSTSVPFTFKNDQLLIPIKDIAIDQTQPLVVDISFTVKVPQMGTRFGVKDGIWLLTTWYPTLNVLDENNEWYPRPNPMGYGDPFYFEHSDYDVYLLAPKEIKWLGSGPLISETDSDGQVLLHWQESMIRNFALVGSRNYTIYEHPTDDDVTIQVALTDDSHLDEVRDIIEYSYPLFRETFGQLPYKTVSIAETSWSTNFALEYPNLAIFSKDLYSQGLLERWLSHEFAHSWWYNTVGNHEVTEGWIDEGLVEHAVVLHLENRYGKERGEQLRNYFRERNQLLIRQTPNMTMNRHLNDFGGRVEYFDTWYHRAADMFLTLREQLGDIKYSYFLKTLYESSAGKIINIEALNMSLRETINGNHNYFNDWVTRPFSQTPFTLAAEPLPIKINGQHLGSEDVRYVQWDLYVTETALYDVLFKQSESPLTIDAENGQLYFNGQIVFCPPAIQDDDQWLIPIEVIKQIAESNFVYDYDRNMLTINIYYFK